MRHNKKFNHLSRTASHRKAMLANMAVSLIMHKRITTTLAKAKALKMYVEPLITRSKTDTMTSRRVVFRYLQNKYAVTELFKEISTKVADRPGGASLSSVHARAMLLTFVSSSLLTSMRTWPRLRRQLRRLVVAAVQRAPKLLKLQRLPLHKRLRPRLLLKKLLRLNNQFKKYISIIGHGVRRHAQFYYCLCG